MPMTHSKSSGYLVFSKQSAANNGDSIGGTFLWTHDVTF
jgi:hypothetical protein